MEQFQVKFHDHHRNIVLGLGPGNELGPSSDLGLSTKFKSWSRPFGLNPGPGPALYSRPTSEPVLGIPIINIKASYRASDLRDRGSGCYMITDVAETPW